MRFFSLPNPFASFEAPLARQLRAAIAGRRADQLQVLLVRHGLPAFAAALSPWSERVVLDGLSLLGAAQRCAVLHHLPRPMREHLAREGGRLLRSAPRDHAADPGIR